MKTRTCALVLAVVTVLALAGCGSGADSSARSASTAEETGTLTVLAASSLTEAFTRMARTFEASHPGVKVRLSFDSSATLADQVTKGAPADVIATADESSMQPLVDNELTSGNAEFFATNHLQVVVPHDNPAGITRFADLSKPGVKYVVCVDTAPCGKLAASVLQANHITAAPASQEVDVKAVLSKVELGEADAGVVYATDAKAGGAKVKAVDIPTSHQNVNSYPIAALTDAKKPVLADDWVALVTSPQGQRVLAASGFGKP